VGGERQPVALAVDQGVAGDFDVHVERVNPHDRPALFGELPEGGRRVLPGWDASAVSRIETGRRGLDLEEFLALPIVLTLALNEPVTLTDLLDVDVDEALNLKNLNRKIMIHDVTLPLAEPFIVRGEHDVRLEGGTPTEVLRRFLDREKRRIQKEREPAEERSGLRELHDLADELALAQSKGCRQSGPCGAKATSQSAMSANGSCWSQTRI
jgi:hypothetical protein